MKTIQSVWAIWNNELRLVWHGLDRAWRIILVSSMFCLSPKVNAQSFDPLHHFTGGAEDGAYPSGGLVLDGSTLYGVTSAGENFNAGTVYKIDLSGGGFAILHSFSGDANGIDPNGRVAISNGIIYGTTYRDGVASYNGTIYKLNTNGSGFTVLRRLGTAGSDGRGPHAGVVLSDGVLYGATGGGGSLGWGGVFKIKTDGTGYQVLRSFTGNSDGAPSGAELTLVNGVLYGTTESALSSSGRTLYRIGTNGAGYSVLHTFSSAAPPGDAMGLVGCRLELVGDTLYGQGLELSGAFGFGSTAFSIHTDGSGYRIVARLPGGTADTTGGFTFANGNLFGCANIFTDSRPDNLYTFNTNGSGYSTLYEFPAQSGDHVNDLVWKSNAAYGVSFSGGLSNAGVIFRLDLRPRLAVRQSGASATVSWPAYAGSYSLEQSTNLSATNWMTVPVSPTSDGTNSSVTLPITNLATFFRLRQ